jgi:hypothetical protein
MFKEGVHAIGYLLPRCFRGAPVIEPSTDSCRGSCFRVFEGRELDEFQREGIGGSGR